MAQPTPAQKRAWYAKCRLATLRRHVRGLPADVLEGCTLRQLSLKVRAAGRGQQTLRAALHAGVEYGRTASTDAHNANCDAKNTCTACQGAPHDEVSPSCKQMPQ